jgi:phage shock protein A
MLDLSYEDLLDQLAKVRQGLVSIAAARKQAELQEQQLQQTVDHLNDQAKAALAQGREDLAREALNRKAAAQAKVSDSESQRQDLAEQEQKMEQALTALQTRVTNFRSQKEVLKAQYSTARAEAGVSGVATGVSGDAGADLQRAMDKIATMQARAGAMDELIQSGVLEDVGGQTDDIQSELDEAGQAAEVDKQLAALRAEIASSAPPPELPAGG